MNNNKCLASTEIVGAMLLPYLTDGEMLNFLTCPMDFIRTHCNVDIPEDYSVKIVINTEEEVYLALPYYSSLEQLKTKGLSDTDLHIIVGGSYLNEVGSAFTGTIVSEKISGTETLSSLGLSLIERYFAGLAPGDYTKST